jgi:hypothetical protein
MPAARRRRIAASFSSRTTAMLRSISIAILILTGVVVLCLLAVRLVASTLYALSGIPRRDAREQILSW